MSKRLFGRTGGRQPNHPLEIRLQAAARALPYPPTPDLAGAVRQQLTIEVAGRSSQRPAPSLTGPLRRRFAWAAVAVMLILGGLLAVPQVRAAVVEFLQIGAIRIFLTEPTPTPAPAPEATPTGSSGQQRPQPSPTPLARLTPRPTPTPLASLLDLAGETTLAAAQEQAGFPIRRPTYPADLGEPERVFFQDLGGPAVVLVWLDPEHPDRVRLSLHELGPGTFGQKGEPVLIQETTVHGQQAYWTSGPYMLQFRRGGGVGYDVRRLVEGNVLIWVEDGITYRLESGLSLAEAVRIAESLR